MPWSICSSSIDMGLPRSSSYDIIFFYQNRHKNEYNTSPEISNYYSYIDKLNGRSITNKSSHFVSGLFISTRDNDNYEFQVTINNCNSDIYHEHWHSQYVLYGCADKIPFLIDINQKGDNIRNRWINFVYNYNNPRVGSIKRYTCIFNIDRNAFIFHFDSLDFLSGLITSLIWQGRFDDLLKINIFNKFHPCNYSLTYNSPEHLNIQSVINQLYDMIDLPFVIINIIEDYYLSICSGTDQYSCKTYYDKDLLCQYHSECNNSKCLNRCGQCANRHSKYDVSANIRI